MRKSRSIEDGEIEIECVQSITDREPRWRERQIEIDEPAVGAALARTSSLAGEDDRRRRLSYTPEPKSRGSTQSRFWETESRNHERGTRIQRSIILCVFAFCQIESEDKGETVWIRDRVGGKKGRDLVSLSAWFWDLVADTNQMRERERSRLQEGSISYRMCTLFRPLSNQIAGGGGCCCLRSWLVVRMFCSDIGDPLFNLISCISCPKSLQMSIYWKIQPRRWLLWWWAFGGWDWPKTIANNQNTFWFLHLDKSRR